MTPWPDLYLRSATAAWLLLLVWPFTRLVHAWSIPLQYLGRPFILYRRLLLVAWIGSHSETELAQSMNVSYTHQTVPLCEQYLSRFGRPIPRMVAKPVSKRGILSRLFG